MTSCTYRLPYFLFMAATRFAWSMSFSFTPGVFARSVTAAVGRPPTQKNASILRSLMAFTDSATPSRSRFMSRSLSSPAASMTRNAITSVALPPEPVETRLPLRSFIILMPVPAIRIHDEERAHRDRLALELVLALVGVQCRIGHRHAEIGLARVDELEIRDRATRYFRGRLDARHIFRQYRRHATAERVIHAA